MADTWDITIKDDAGATVYLSSLPRFNLGLTVDPAATDDGAAGYAKGSRAVNTTGKSVWACVDNTNSAADWRRDCDDKNGAAVKFVRAATTTNGTLATAFASGQTIDGVVLATGDRILIKDQTTTTNSNAGATSPGRGSTQSLPGLTWGNPGNITANDALYARAPGNLISTADTDWLVADTFGFSIPVGATIAGIVIRWERRSVGGTVTTSAIRVVKGGTIGATELSSLPTWPTTEGFESVGGTTNLCGETWTPADINSSSFGAALKASVTANGNADVDYCDMNVYYTTSGGPSPDNGVYVVQTSGAPVRAADANTADELLSACVAVKKGTVNAGTLWADTDETITLGSTAVTFAKV